MKAKDKIIELKTIISILMMLLMTSPINSNNISREFEVDMMGMKFNPKEIDIPMGSTIVWENKSGMQHNVVSENRLFRSDLLKKENTFKMKFDKPGRYPYYCEPHKIMGMKGVIVVK